MCLPDPGIEPEATEPSAKPTEEMENHKTSETLGRERMVEKDLAVLVRVLVVSP